MKPRCGWPLRTPVDLLGRAAPVGGELFPHLYGPLELEALVALLPFAPGPDGTFLLPEELAR